MIFQNVKNSLAPPTTDLSPKWSPNQQIKFETKISTRAQHIVCTCQHTFPVTWRLTVGEKEGERQLVAALFLSCFAPVCRSHAHAKIATEVMSSVRRTSASMAGAESSQQSVWKASCILRYRMPHRQRELASRVAYACTSRTEHTTTWTNL